MSSRWPRYGSRELRPRSHWRTSKQGFLNGGLFGGSEGVGVGIPAEAVGRLPLMSIRASSCTAIDRLHAHAKFRSCDSEKRTTQVGHSLLSLIPFTSFILRNRC